jgi:bacillithiol synthase
MATTALGDVSNQLACLEEACGSASELPVLDAVRTAYSNGATVGGAYVTLLRALLEPLGVAVLDASHASVRAAGTATVLAALERADEIAVALRARSTEIADAGFRAQVADVPNLSLVFQTLDDGTRKRIPVRNARTVGSTVGSARDASRLGPNVLLRPVMERQILPTVSYVGGAGEVAYFAQVSAVAETLGMAIPRISPRWSGTLVEPHIETILDRLGATIADFADPHAMESRVARKGVSPGVRAALDGMRAELEASCARLRADDATTAPLARSIGAMRAAVQHRLDRLERRYAAAVKNADSDELRDVAMLRATLFPGGVPQERALSFIPFLARHGDAVVAAAREQAQVHVTGLIQGD